EREDRSADSGIGKPEQILGAGARCIDREAVLCNGIVRLAVRDRRLYVDRMEGFWIQSLTSPLGEVERRGLLAGKKDCDAMRFDYGATTHVMAYAPDRRVAVSIFECEYPIAS